MLEETFKELGLSDPHYLIYKSLLEYGPTSARKLAERLGINRPTTYDYLKALVQKGLIIEQFEGSKNLYQIDDPKQLARLLDDKIERLSDEKKRVEVALPALLQQADSIDPKFKFYSGQEGVRQALNQVLYSDEKESIAMWSIEEVVGLLGAQNMLDINEKRVRSKLYVRTVWSDSGNIAELNKKYNRLGQDSIREVRQAPNEMGDLKMGYWLAGNTVAFISTKREAYGFVIRSRDFADFLRAQFEMVWANSELIVKD